MAQSSKNENKIGENETIEVFMNEAWKTNIWKKSWKSSKYVDKNKQKSKKWKRSNECQFPMLWP
jgi:hypothetical protein